MYQHTGQISLAEADVEAVISSQIITHQAQCKKLNLKFAR